MQHKSTSHGKSVSGHSPILGAAATRQVFHCRLEHHRIAIDTMVEITLVAVLREMTLKGVLHIDPILIAASSLFIVVLGLLLRLGGLRYAGPDTFSRYEPFYKHK